MGLIFCLIGVGFQWALLRWSDQGNPTIRYWVECLMMIFTGILFEKVFLPGIAHLF